MILRLRTGWETLILGPRAEFAGVAGGDCGALVSEYEVRRRLRIALADPEGADALRRAFGRWLEEGARIREADDRAVIDRVARMSRNGTLAAFVVADRSKQLGKAEAISAPASGRMTAESWTSAHAAPIRRKLEMILPMALRYLSGASREELAPFVEGEARLHAARVLEAWAVAHWSHPGDIVDDFLTAFGGYASSAPMGEGIHLLRYAFDLLRDAANDRETDAAARAFAAAIETVGAGNFSLALSHAAGRRGAFWVTKKESLRRGPPPERAPKMERPYVPRPAPAPAPSRPRELAEGESQSQGDKPSGGASPADAGVHFVQEKANSCVVASSRNVIKELTGVDIPESVLRTEIAALMNSPNHDFDRQGINPLYASKLLAAHGVPNEIKANATLAELADLTAKGKPVLIGFKNPGHRVVLDGVSETKDGKKIFLVRDPAPSYRGRRREMTEEEFQKKYNSSAIVIAPK